MNFSNTLLVGFYISFIIIFIYCYWAYVYYKKSSTRIGILASTKYKTEMMENDPNSKGFSAQKAQVIVSPDGTQATVKFNIFNDANAPVGGAIRKYNIVDEENKCATIKIVNRIDSAECQFPEFLDDYQKTQNCIPWQKGKGIVCAGGPIPDDDLVRCTSRSTTGLGCIWL
jgi:hypothetical protein